MADKVRPMLRVDDRDYDYVYEVAVASARRGERPNCTAALRKIIREHRIYGGKKKVYTTPCVESVIN